MLFFSLLYSADHIITSIGERDTGTVQYNPIAYVPVPVPVFFSSVLWRAFVSTK
jgi:hypothetical protein